MVIKIPPIEVINAIEAGITHVTRRLAFTEADGVTPWQPPGGDAGYRLVGGEVSIDSNRAERRTLDCELDNADNSLRPRPGGMWYDKVLKPYRGVRYPVHNVDPSIVIIESYNGMAGAKYMQDVLQRIGYTATVNLNASSVADVKDFNIVVSAMGAQGATQKSALLKQCYLAGKGIITFSRHNTSTQVPLIRSTGAVGAAQVVASPVPTDTPLAGGWGAQPVTQGGTATAAVTGLSAAAVAVAVATTESVTNYPIAIEENSQGGRWLNWQGNLIHTQHRTLLKRGIQWLWNYSPYREWESPLGCFLPDSITNYNFPNTLKIGARDFTKKCLGAKLALDRTYAKNYSTNAILRELAVYSGIPLSRISFDPTSDRVLSKAMTFTRGTDCWAIMKQIADYQARNIYFDESGILVTEPYPDPLLGTPKLYLATSKNLVSYERSTSDSRIYNHIVVTATADEEGAGLNYTAQAMNDNKNSPTRVSLLGRKTYTYESQFFTTKQQCQNYANKLLTQTAFEQYEINFESLVYPWMDAGLVMDLKEPRNLPQDPTRFLLDTITIPLSLTAMGGSGKRILFVEEGAA